MAGFDGLTYILRILPIMTFLFALLFILLILTFARQAWLNGVLAQYWGMIGLVAGMGAGYLFFQYSAAILEQVAPDRYLPLLPNVIVSGAIGLIVYFIARSIAKAILSSYFDPDSALIDWTDGLRGAIFSLIPSVITILILVSGIRLGGTLMELRHLEKICRPNVNYLAKNYPRWSSWAKWRNSIEAIPLLTLGLKSVDPISRVPERRIVCLLVASKKPQLLEYLRSSPETAAIIGSSSMQDVMTSEEIAVLLKESQHVTMLKHPLILQAAHDSETEDALDKLELQQLIDRFMLSPERLDMIKNEKIVMILKHLRTFP